MTARRRRLLVVAGTLLVVLGVPPVVVYLDARRDIARELRRVEAEIAEERARLANVKLPCLRGEPIDDSARVRLAPLLAGRGEPNDATWALEEPLLQGEPLSAKARAALEKQGAEIPLIRGAVRCTRLSVPSLEWRPDVPNLVAWRNLVNVLVLSALERATVGDDRSSVETLLDAARLGLEAMYGDSAAGPLYDTIFGAGMQAYALRQLGRLVARHDLSPELHRQIERELDLLEASAPRAHDVWLRHGMWRRRELSARGHLTGLENTDRVDAQGRIVLDGWSAAVPRTVVIARALGEVDAIVTAVDPTPGEDLQALDTKVGVIESRFYKHWNPYVRVFAGGSSINWFRDCQIVWVLVRGAIIVEDLRRANGVAPPVEVISELPVDSRSPSRERLRYRPGPDARSWKLWSVGPNGHDDGGESKKMASDPDDDIVLERHP